MKRILATYIVLSILTSRTAHSVEPEYADRALIIRSPELLDAPEFAGTACDGGTQGRYSFASLLRFRIGENGTRSVNDYLDRLTGAAYEGKDIRALRQTCGAETDPNTYPLRLLAIVNRVDLFRRDVSCGELRFVFGAWTTKGPANVFAILELSLACTSAKELKDWAKDWHELSAITSPERYRERLVAILEEGKRKSVKAPWRIRANMQRNAGTWRFTQDGVNAVAVFPEPLSGQPDVKDNCSASLEKRIQTLAASGDPHAMEDATYPGSKPVFDYPFGFVWQTSMYGDPQQIRHKFAVNTCAGCHGQETRNPFTPQSVMHIFNRRRGETAKLSDFLTSPREFKMTKPARDCRGRLITKSEAARSFGDLERRRAVIQSILTSNTREALRPLTTNRVH